MGSSPSSRAVVACSRARCQRPADHSSRPGTRVTTNRLPSSPRAAASRFLEHHAGAVELSERMSSRASKTRGFRCSRARGQALLELCSPLEQAGSDLGRPRLCLAQTRDRDREQSGVADSLGFLQGRPSVGQSCVDVARVQVNDARSARTRADGGRRRRLPRPAPRRRARSSPIRRVPRWRRAWKRTSALSTPDAASVRSCSSRGSRAPSRRQGGTKSPPVDAVSAPGPDRQASARRQVRRARRHRQSPHAQPPARRPCPARRR